MWKRITFRLVNSLENIFVLENTNIVIPRAKELVELKEKVYEVKTIKHFPEMNSIVILMEKI